METVERKWGWKPDLGDQRDYLFSRLLRPEAKLPTKVDLRPLCSPVEDQGNLGSCTANALVANLEFLEIKDKKPFQDFSRLFLYFNERAIEGTVSYDSGAMIRDGVKTLTKQGCCSEKNWPYTISKFKSKPAAKCYTEGLTHQITSYYRILTLAEMKQCLAAGFPFVFGFSVYESFESQKVADTGVVPMPKKGEQLLGGHAVLAVGYSDSSKRFIVRNSWGPDWGQKGYFTLPYAYLSNTDLSDDLWYISAGKGM